MSHRDPGNTLELSPPPEPLKSYLYKELARIGTDNSIQSLILRGLTIVGGIDTTLLRRCFQHVLDRHEILRTSFQPRVRLGPTVQKGWHPVCEALRTGSLTDSQVFHNVLFEQCIHRSCDLEIELVERDIRLDLSEQIKIETADVTKHFDFSRVPMFRAKLLRVNEAECRLMLAAPHIALDGRSMTIVITEVFRCYAAADPEGRCLVKPKLSYGAFAAQLSETEKSKPIYQDAPPTVVLFDTERLDFRIRRGANTFGLFHIKRLEDRISYEGTGAAFVKGVARAYRVTVPMLVFSCFATVLHLLAQQNHIVIVGARYNRANSNSESVVGPLADGVALAIDYSEIQTFREVTSQARNEFSDAAGELLTNRRTTVSEELQRSADGPFHRSASIEVGWLPDYCVPGLTVEDFHIPPTLGSGDPGLILRVHHGEKRGIALTLNYCTDCFLKESVSRMLGAIVEMIRVVGDSPDISISDLHSITRSV